jgi:putative hydrolase of the HAD superfamily
VGEAGTGGSEAMRGGREVKAVFFDAGETLLYPHPSFPELLAEVVREQGHAVDPADVQKVMADFSRRFTESFREHRLWSTSAERSRAFWFSIYREFLERVGIDDPDGTVVRALYQRFSDLASYRLHPDALPVLDRLHTAGVVLGLISNFEEWLERLLETLEVTRFFPVRVISGVEGVEKPDPEIFRIALDRAGVAAEDSVYVGDHPVFDVDAAARVGMLPVLIDRRGRHPDADCIRVTSLEDLPASIGLDA